MKYIDAEKLKASVQKGFDSAKESEEYDDDMYETGRADAYEDVIHIIDSLQQEQPDGLHFTPLNRLIRKIPSKKWNDNTNNYAKNLRDCLIKEGYLKDAKVLQDYISYMNGNNIPMATMDEQKQPKIELKNYISNKLRELGDDLINSKLFAYTRGLNVGRTNAYRDILDRLNARKEE